MSSPMFPEKWESSTSKSSRRVSKRRERKMWKKPIKLSRFPSFGFSGSDFTVDQIPAIFSGYTAESEDSSSSDMSDDSRTYSKSSDENEEIDQERSRSVKRRAKSKSISRISSMKVLRRQSTRTLYGGSQRLKKMRSIKRLTSNSRHILRKKNLDREDFGLLQPHYLRPTSSSASKNVENIQKNLGVARLKRIASLRYNGLLKATCSSAMKGSSSKKSNDVCTYRYCSLHGRRHSHAADSNVSVPSLKQFVSMRRKFLNRQKSVNRRLVLLKRTLSRKRGPLGGRVVTDQESKEVDDNVDGDSDQEVFEEEVSSSENGGNDKESIGRSSETIMVDVDDNADRGMDSMETVASEVQESKPETLDDSNGTNDKDMKKNATLWHAICEQTVTGLDHDDGKVKVEGTKSEETVGDNEEVCREGSSGEMREEDGKKTEIVWNETVTLVKQAFDEILAEITDDDSSDDISITKDEPLEGGLEKEDVGADSSDSNSSDMQPIIGGDTHLSVIASTFHMRDEFDHQRGPKKWSYLKRVILLKRFLKSLDRKERRKLSDGKESETIMRLRRELVGERKNAEEWMLDHALRQVISTLAPSQKKKVKHLVKAFESLIPMDGGSRGHDDLESPGREENDTMNSPTILRNNEDTTDIQEVLPAKDLEETNLTSEASSSLSIDMKSDEALESIAAASLCNHLAVEEEVDGLASGSFIEEEEKKGDSEKQNLFTWRNLIQKHMVMRNNSEGNRDETDQEHKWSYGTDQMAGIDDANAAAVKSIQLAFETILSEIPDSSSDEEIVSESSNSLKEEKEDQGETKKSWNSLRKVILLKRFVKSLEKVQVYKPRKMRSLPVESAFEAENVLLRHRSLMEGRRTDGEELMLDYALRQAISRLAPIQRKKVDLLVQAFDIVLDGHDTPKQTKTSDTPRNNDETSEEGKPRVEEDYEVNKDEQKIKNVFARVQVHQKDLKGEEEVVSTPKESRKLPPIRNVKQRIVVEKEKDSRMWKLIYKHMVTEKEGNDSANGESVASVEGECDDEAVGLQIDARRSGTVTLVREALEKILSEIPDNSSDDQSMDSDITTDQELFERYSQVSEESVSSAREITFKPKSNEKRVKGWNNVKKVILLKRFVSDLGSLTRLSPKTPRVLPWEPDPETEKIRLRHQEIGGKRNSEEWMLDYALRQAISTLAPSQKRKVSLLAQAFDTISLQDMGSGSTPGSATSSRNISRQSSISSMAVHSENEANAEIIRGKLRNLQEDLKESTKFDGVAKDLEEKQQCSSLWRILCKQMEDNEKNQTLPEETRKEEQEEEELKEDTSVDGEKMELYQTEAVELLGEVIDGIALEESQDQNHVQGETMQKSETLQVSKVRIDRWSNLKRAILLRRFVKALENVRKFNPREPRFLPPNPEVEAEKVNLRHQETQNKKNGDEWMVDNALQGVVSKLTPARKLKVQLLVQAFETLSGTGN
ncbi:Calmodulin-binding domain plant [Arabidopsis suecica]|uniref:Calmodulin-binding domain plant n=1 Tax=Arabidopsis suecica TaxID=45249 RepID=A0A8T1Z525_ARASU|nr:Calmodulin-binding domain plant [Arabidopsis suecica]